jgi:choline dehydrogenase-like flavoprotein
VRNIISQGRLSINDSPHVAWKQFGGSSWGWDGLSPYFKKAETFHPASVQTPWHDPHTADTRFVGTHGPVQVRLVGRSLTTRCILIQLKQVTLSALYWNITGPFISTVNQLGIPTSIQPVKIFFFSKISRINSRQSRMAAMQLGHSIVCLEFPMPLSLGHTESAVGETSINKTSGRRSYSATTYHALASSRSNYFVLLGADVTKVNFAPHVSPAKATSVSFVFGGQTYSAQVRKEVIVSAGEYQNLMRGGCANILDRHTEDSPSPRALGHWCRKQAKCVAHPSYCRPPRCRLVTICTVCLI